MIYGCFVPDMCPTQVYDIMCDCWKNDDTARPTFSELLERLLAVNKNIANFYISANCLIQNEKETSYDKMPAV